MKAFMDSRTLAPALSHRMREGVAKPTSPFIAIACGGTGGHLFPGLAVAEQIVERACAVALLVSQKDVDQQAVKSAEGMEIVTLPAVGLQRGCEMAFVRGFSRSYRVAKRLFTSRPEPLRRRGWAALAMGGFTSAGPILAAKSLGAQTFLHESNTIPGRANRWLSWVVNRAFVGFPSTRDRLNNRNVTVIGTPVRRQFRRAEGGGRRAEAACRTALGLDAARPVVLVMGGSQGASAINQMVIETLPVLAKVAPGWQWFHLSGPGDEQQVRQTYAALKLTAVVHSFFAEMELALGAATAAISRAGASSLAELAALRVPTVLVPYPSARGNHQFHNARALGESGAAVLLDQKSARPEELARLLVELVQNTPARQTIQSALARWHRPRAAEQIADIVLRAIGINQMENAECRMQSVEVA